MKSKVQDITFVLAMIGLLVFSFFRITKGFIGYDETFYWTIPHRILQGDALFRQEWHVAQIHSIAVLPFVALYEAIKGSTEGIVLYMRAVYVIVHGAVSVFAYLRLRKYGYGALIGTLLFFLYTPATLMTLNYAALGIDCLAVTGVIAATAKRPYAFAVAGVIFAVAVLCCPLMMIVYGLYAVAVIAGYIIKRVSGRWMFHQMFSVKNFVFFTAGAAVIAIAVAVFVLSRATIKDITESIPYINNDPEHREQFSLNKLSQYLNALIFYKPFQPIPVFAYIASLIAMAADKERYEHRPVYLAISIAAMLSLMAMYNKNMIITDYDAVVFPFIFVGITSYLLCKNKQTGLFIGVFVLGLLYSMIVHIGSNQGAYVIYMAMVICDLAGAIFFCQLIKEMMSEAEDLKIGRILGVVCLVIVLGTQLTAEIMVRAKHIFWQQNFSIDRKVKLDVGPAKGITTDGTYGDDYNKLIKDLEYYKDKKPGNIVFFSRQTWGYLYLYDFPNAAYSSWLSGSNTVAIARLEDYWRLNPDKHPEYIYIERSTPAFGATSLIDQIDIRVWAKEKGYSVTENDVSYKLESKK